MLLVNPPEPKHHRVTHNEWAAHQLLSVIYFFSCVLLYVKQKRDVFAWIRELFLVFVAFCVYERRWRILRWRAILIARRDREWFRAWIIICCWRAVLTLVTRQLQIVSTIQQQLHETQPRHHSADLHGTLLSQQSMVLFPYLTTMFPWCVFTKSFH